MTAKNIGTGILFPNAAKSIFMRVSGERYDRMAERVRKKGFYGDLPFSKERFRQYLLIKLGGVYDGFTRCRYCTGFFTIEQIAIDHAIPLGRGGGVELSNLDIPCIPCNRRKGKMAPEEYLALLDFLDTRLPLAKTDVLERLEKAVPLARGFSHLKAKAKAALSEPTPAAMAKPVQRTG